MSLKNTLLTRLVGWRRPAVPNPEAPEPETPEPKLPDPEAPTAKDDWDKALDELADPVEEPGPEEKTPLQDPAELAAIILLEEAMRLRPVTAEELTKPGVLSVVIVPGGEWAEPVFTAWKSSVSGHEGTVNASCRCGFNRYEIETVAFIRGVAPDKHVRTHDDAMLEEAIWRTQRVVGVSADEGWLPQDLVTASDHRLTLPPLHPAAASELARRLTGTEPTIQITEAEARAAGPRLLKLSRRPEQTADEYLSKLREVVRAATPAADKETAPQAATPRDSLTLDRLAGMDEAVQWGMALAKDIAAFRIGERDWADVDRGLLLSGPPGCGKTVYAQALARTCGVPVIQGSWSSWLANGTGHQGDFLLALKRTFADARAKSPCILFLDEVDSFPNRGELTHAYKDWDIQVVNALLAELDGVESRPGVVVVAACNNPHLLDPALVRSGRLDRHIRIRPPGRKALSMIMREHLGDDLAGQDLDGAALLASGATGADVERIVRGARRRARDAKRPMELTDLLAEIGGRDDRTPHELYLSAVHEAGHAVAAVEIGIGVRGVTIRATDTTGGGFSRGRASYFMTEHDIHDELVCLLAGRAAEQVVLGEASCGAGGGADSDLAVATWIAARGVSECGFDGQRGLLWQPISERRADLGDALSRDAVLAEMVRQRLADAYSDACALLLRRRTAVDAVATALLERTALDGGEVARIVDADGRGLL